MWQHLFSCLSTLGKGAQALYNKVQSESRVPKLEKARLEWVELLKEHVADVKKIRKLGVDVVELEKSIA